MLSAILNVISEAAVELVEFFVLSGKPFDLFVPFVHLIDPQSVSIFSLVQSFCQVIVSHAFSLGAFLVMD